MAGKRLLFTKGNIESLPLPLHGNVMYHDTKIPGLVLRVFPSGTKSYSLFRRIQGDPENITIGRFPQMTPEQARDEAERLNGDIANKKNPAKVKRDKKEEATLQDAFDSWIVIHAKVRKKSWKADVWQFNKYLDGWKNRKLSSIKCPDIISFHAKLATNNGKYTANRVLALLSTIFNHSRKMNFITEENPCIGVEKIEEVDRSRRIREEELSRFFDALMEEPDTTARDAILMMLYTGQRRDNILTMRWDEISLVSEEWIISGAKTKSKKEHIVPLVGAAMKILRTRYKETESEWVFPSARRDNHIREPKGPWKNILSGCNLKDKKNVSKITDLHFHDLRRTLATYMANTGTSELIIAGMLGHSVKSVTGIYARYDLRPIREGMERAIRYMLIKGGVIAEDENVIEYRASI